MKIKSCCTVNKKTKKCIRQKDKKKFNLPRRFSKKRCLSKPIKGFTMKSSCAPFKYCKSQRGGNPVTLPELENCANESDPITFEPFTQADVDENNIVKVKVDVEENNEDNDSIKKPDLFHCFEKQSFENWVDFEYNKTKSSERIRNPYTNEFIKKDIILSIYPDIEGDNKKSKNPHESLIVHIKEFIDDLIYDDLEDQEQEILDQIANLIHYTKPLIPLSEHDDLKTELLLLSTDILSNKPNTLREVVNIINRELNNDQRLLQSAGKKKKVNKKKTKKNKKRFLYNPDDPKRSFDVYIDKDPSDTISIKYATVKDVENTIKKLESLYKQGKYSHKRIWQVGMIMKVRLEAMKKHKKKMYPKAKNVTSRFNLANRYFKFLGKRTKTKKNKRKNISFR